MIEDYGIDARIVDGVPGLRERGIFHESILNRVLGKGENALVRIALSRGRREALLLPALAWLMGRKAEDSGRVLILGADPASARELAEEWSALIAPLPEGERGVFAPAGFEAAAARVVVSCPQELSPASGEEGSAPSFGFLALEGADRIVALAEDSSRRLVQALGADWGRRGIVEAGKLNPAVKNLAWDLVMNPVELEISEASTIAASLAQETWHISTEDKLRFLLAHLPAAGAESVVVVCNLRATVEELRARLERNGIQTRPAPAKSRSAEGIASGLASGAAPGAAPGAASGTWSADATGEAPNRPAGGVQIAQRAGLVLMTDADFHSRSGLSFTRLINYDFPLEPELYLRRLQLLDRGAPGVGVVNLVCDRYVYGLSAVESYLKASLSAREVGEDMLAPEDASAGLIYRGPEEDAYRPGQTVPKGRLEELRIDPSGSQRPAPGRQGPRPRTQDRGPRQTNARAPGRGFEPPPFGPAEQGQGGPRGPQAGFGRRPGAAPDSPMGRKPAGPRDQGRAGETKGPQGGRGDARARRPDEDRAPDIRRSIAEATGGNLGRADSRAEGGEGRKGGKKRHGSRARADGRPDSAALPEQYEPARPQEREPEKSGAAPDAPQGGSGRGRRGKKGDRRAERGPRDERKDQPEPRPDARRGGKKRHGQGRPGQTPPEGPALGGNPYELSMEERMRRYREKYGNAAGQGGEPGAQPPGGVQSRSEPRGRRRRGERPRLDEGASGRPSEGPGSPGSPPPADLRGAEDEGAGMLGKIFGRWKKKDE